MNEIRVAPIWLDLPLSEIRPSRWQYRRRWDPEGLLELARSIESHGLINRLLVFRDEDDEHYEIVAGERRLRACAAIALVRAGDRQKLADAIPIVTDPHWWDAAADFLHDRPDTVVCELLPGVPADFREIVLIENLQRENPSAIEEAEAYQLLIREDGYTQRRLAQRLGKSQAYISQRLGLLGLAEEVRDVVETEEISFTAARAIATLPPAVQSAVTTHVQELARDSVDAQATTRQVQAITRQIRNFLDLDHWDPPHDFVIAPERRNRLRLIQYCVASANGDQLGEAIVRLRQVKDRWGSGVSNWIGKKPLTLARDRDTVETLVYQLTGETTARSLYSFWETAAVQHDWTCTYCQFDTARQPAACEEPHCPRWRGEDRATCFNFVQVFDPLVIPLTYDQKRAAETLGVPVHTVPSERFSGFAYMDDLPAYAGLLERHIAALQAAQQAEARCKQEGHLVQLRQYWGAQHHDGDVSFELSHGQAHTCRRCAHYAPALLDLKASDGQPLPPCQFAVEPLKRNSWSEDTVAPDMGVLVAKSGLMVPRCVEFRQAEFPSAEIPPIAPSAGFRFPTTAAGRSVVYDWLRRLAYSPSGNSHYSTLSGVLSWLPYGRDPGQSQDMDTLIRFIRAHWDELGGDEAVATLMTVALSESTARGNYQERFTLVDPTTGESERWVGISWKTFQEGRLPSYAQYPNDWPRPWAREEESVD